MHKRPGTVLIVHGLGAEPIMVESVTSLIGMGVG